MPAQSVINPQTTSGAAGMPANLCTSARNGAGTFHLPPDSGLVLRCPEDGLQPDDRARDGPRPDPAGPDVGDLCRHQYAQGRRVFHGERGAPGLPWNRCGAPVSWVRIQKAPQMPERR